MPQNEYTIRDPQSGLVITVRGDAPPNEAQLDELFAAARTRGADTPGEEPMSLSGFAGNVLKSGGRFVRDTVQGANTLAEMITPKTTIERGLRLARDPIGESRRMAETVRSIPGIARALPGAIGTAAKERYGSAEAIKNTLYKDPVGVLSDVSTVLPAGAALKATKAPALVRLGSKAVRAADMIDPLSLAMRVPAGVARGASDAAIAMSLKPSQALREQHGGFRGIADTVRKERVIGAKQAEEKLTGSQAEARRLIEEADEAGHQGIEMERVIGAVEGEPRQRALTRAKLGQDADLNASDELIRKLRERHPGTREVPPTRIETPAAPDSVDAALRAERELGRPLASQIPTQVFGTADPAAIEAARKLGPMADVVPRRLLGTSQEPARVVEMGGRAATPPRVRLPEAQDMLREAQTLAYELGKQNQSVGSLQNRAMARELKTAIAEAVPDIAPVNERSQKLLGLKRAFAEADIRKPSVAGEAGQGFMLGTMFGNPVKSAIGRGAIAALESPRLGAAAGIAFGDMSQAMRNPAIARLARGLRAQGLSDALIEEIIKRELAQQQQGGGQ